MDKLHWEDASGYDSTGITDKMRQIANDFASAGISMELAEDLLLGRWKNWCGIFL